MYTKEIEQAKAKGFYVAKCYDKDGNLKWEDNIINLVTTVGKNLALDTLFAGAAYTVTGPFLGLISSVSYSTIVVGDTMASHAGWTEAGGTNAPTFTGNRQTAAFSAASAGAKAMSPTLVYTMTGSGTIKGCFLVLGTGAVATKDNTGGVLYSAGLFTGGDKVVSSGDTLTVSYTASL